MQVMQRQLRKTEQQIIEKTSSYNTSSFSQGPAAVFPDTPPDSRSPKNKITKGRRLLHADAPTFVIGSRVSWFTQADLLGPAFTSLALLENNLVIHQANFSYAGAHELLLAERAAKINAVTFRTQQVNAFEK
jgi:hypothetical protein